MLNAFCPTGQTIALTTSGTGSTAQIRAVLPSNFGMSAYPQQLRMVNTGATTVWVWFSTLPNFTIVVPTAGTTTVGTPQLGIYLIQNVVEIFTFPQGFATAGNTPLYIADISTATSLTYYLQPGYGV